MNSGIPLLSIVDFLYSFYAKLTSYPFIIQLCIVFILGCILLFSAFMSILSFVRYLYNKKIRTEGKYAPIIDELLLKYLFDDEKEYSEADIYTEFTDKVGRLKKNIIELIIDRLIKCKNSFNFKVNEPYLRLVNALGIEKYIEKGLDFSTGAEKMNRIRQLSNLSITASESKIIPFTYSGNSNLRKESRSSYVRLSKNDPFKYFDEPKESLNNWDQINILKNLMSIENTIIPNFSKWIAYSKNDSIVSFSIKMCAYFKQRESIPALVGMLKNENQELRSQAIKALGELLATEYEDTLVAMYPNEPDTCQIEIIRAIGKFNSGNSLGFLQQAYKDNLSTETKK